MGDWGNYNRDQGQGRRGLDEGRRFSQHDYDGSQKGRCYSERGRRNFDSDETYMDRGEERYGQGSDYGTGKFLVGKRIMLDKREISDIGWQERSIDVNLKQAMVKDAPPLQDEGYLSAVTASYQSITARSEEDSYA